jgi:hypothetical protein
MYDDLPPDQTIEERFDIEVTGRRIVAALIDLVPLTILLVVMTALFGETESTDGPEFSGSRTSLTGWPFVFFIFLALAYYTVLEGLVGKRSVKRSWALRSSPIIMEGDRDSARS